MGRAKLETSSIPIAASIPEPLYAALRDTFADAPAGTSWRLFISATVSAGLESMKLCGVAETLRSYSPEESTSDDPGFR